MHSVESKTVCAEAETLTLNAGPARSQQLNQRTLTQEGSTYTLLSASEASSVDTF